MAHPGTLEADRQGLKAHATKLVAAREALDHVFTAFRRVSASRSRPIRGSDPTRAQRPSTRRHGATRHGQRRAAFEQRAALRAESARRHAEDAEPRRRAELADMATMGHKRMSGGYLDRLIGDAAPTTLPDLIEQAG